MTDKAVPPGDDPDGTKQQEEITHSDTKPYHYDVAAGHRRRREAAERLPPLRCGRRDPLTHGEVALGRSRERESWR
jgi:hypothetical protein